MDIEKIKQANTFKLGKNIIYYEEIASTQDEAKKIVNKPVENGTIVITDNQTKGKGTKGRRWYSTKEKNITMTIILYPRCNLEQIEGITIKIANEISNAIKKLYNINLTIKAPNDLILNNKKIAGILTESTTKGSTLKHILIGIGFNVNQTNFTKETSEIATSLKREFSKEFSIEEIIIAIIENLERAFEKENIF